MKDKKFKISILGIVMLVIASLLVFIPKINAQDNQKGVVFFESQELKKAINQALDKARKADQDITIEEMKNLKTLIVPKEDKITSLKGLEHAVNLNELNITNNQLTKFEGIENLVNLNILDLSGNKITKIEGLDKLTNLSEINLEDNQIAKIEGLDKLASLKHLTLSKNTITKIEGLNNIKGLLTLDLSGNNISKIEGLESLNYLVVLSLAKNNISKIEGLDNLTSVTNLDLSGNNISKIEGLDKLAKLRNILLKNNKISKIENLENLSLLEEVYLDGNSIIKVEGLNIPKLGFLGLNSQKTNYTITSKEFNTFKILDNNNENIDLEISDDFKANVIKISENKYKIDDEGLKKLKESNNKVFKWNKKIKVKNAVDEENQDGTVFSGTISITSDIKQNELFKEKLDNTKEIKVKENIDITKLLLNLPNDATVQVVENIDNSTIGKKKGKIKVIFKDKSEKIIEVMVNVNKFDLLVKYTNKANEVVHTIKSEQKIGNKFTPEDFKKDDPKYGEVSYEVIDKKAVEIKNAEPLTIKVKTIIKFKNLENIDKLKEEFKVTIEYTSKDKKVIKTEEVNVKKGEKLKVQDFEKDNKKYIIKNKEDREKEITKNQKVVIEVIEEVKATKIKTPMTTTIKITTKNLNIKKGDDTIDSKLGIIIPEENKKDIKEIKLLEKGNRNSLNSIKDRYKVIFTDDSSKIVEVVLNITSLEISNIDETKIIRTHYKIEIEYVKNGKTIKKEEKFVKVGSKLELKDFKYNGKDYKIVGKTTMDITKNEKIKVNVKEIVKSVKVEEVLGKDIKTENIRIAKGKDYDTKNAIKIPEELKAKIADIKLVSKCDREKLGNGYDVYKVIFKNGSTRNVRVSVEIFKDGKKIELNQKDDKNNKKPTLNNNKKINRLPNSGSISYIILFAALAIGFYSIISYRKLKSFNKKECNK